MHSNSCPYILCKVTTIGPPLFKLINYSENSIDTYVVELLSGGTAFCTLSGHFIRKIYMVGASTGVQLVTTAYPFENLYNSGFILLMHGAADG